MAFGKARVELDGATVKDSLMRSRQFRDVFLGLLKMRYRKLN